MRSRPHVEVRFSPAHPRAGETVHFEVTITGKTQTPVTNVRCAFRSIETRVTGYVSTGKTTTAVRSTHVYFEEERKTAGLMLGAGEKRDLHFEVRLPNDLPTAYASAMGGIEHRFEVRVDIPWWPDRTALFLIPVGAAPTASPPRGQQRLYATWPDGPRGTELSIELTLDNDVVEQGGELSGAVSLINAEHHTLSRLEVGLRILDGARNSNLTPATIFSSVPLVLCQGQPPSGKSFGFRLLLPPEQPASFESHFIHVGWELEVLAVRPFLPNIGLPAPLTVWESGRSAPPEPNAREHLALGNDRRNQVWERAADQSGLSFNAEDCTLTGSDGALTFSIGLELCDGVRMTVARLTWPETRLGLELRERRWSDVLKKSLSLGEPFFDRRFALQARELSQASTFLSDALRDHLGDFDQVELDDDSAELASAGNAYSVEELNSFVEKVVRTTKDLAAAVENVPAPPGLEPQRAAWSALASAHGGTFHPGDFSIRGATYRGHRCELLARFDAQGFHSGNQARVLLAASVEPSELSAEAQRVLASLSAEIADVRLSAQAVEAPFSGTELEPSKVENFWRQLQRLAKAIDAGAA